MLRGSQVGLDIKTHIDSTMRDKAKSSSTIENLFFYLRKTDLAQNNMLHNTLLE